MSVGTERLKYIGLFVTFLFLVNTFNRQILHLSYKCVCRMHNKTIKNKEELAEGEFIKMHAKNLIWTGSLYVCRVFIANIHKNVLV